MAVETVPVTVSGTSTTVYTCPPATTAELKGMLIRGDSDQDATIQYTDSSASTTTNMVSAARLTADETANFVSSGLFLEPGDTLRVTPLTGSLYVLATFDVRPTDHTTQGFNLSSGTTWTTLVDSTGTRVTPTFLSAANNGNEPNRFRMEFQDSSAGGVWTPICDVLLPPGAPVYYPLVGGLGLEGGDMLRARGVNIGVIVTTNQHSTLRTSVLNIGTSYADIISAGSGTRRIIFLSIMNNDTTTENLDIQYLDSSNSNTPTVFVDDLPVPHGVTVYPLTADITVAPGDALQLKSTGTDLRAVSTVDLS